jgi:hypothetical protein
MISGSLIPLSKMLDQRNPRDRSQDAARDEAFATGRIPILTADQPRIAPALTAGAFHPRTEKTPIRQRPEHVEERIDQKPAMARPVSDDHAGAIAQLREMLPAARKAILATIPYYDVNHSRRAALSKDLAALGGELNEKTGLYHLVEQSKGEAAPAKRARKPAPARAAAAPALDLVALPTAALASLACDVAVELERRAKRGDALLEAVRQVAA